jgi:cystathionine gamma-synthase
MPVSIKVISQQPPGGRCTLYAGYADIVARFLGAAAELVFTAQRDAHGNGYPALGLNEQAALPADGVILMPADVVAALVAAGIPEQDLAGLAESLEAPMERLMEQG